MNLLSKCNEKITIERHDGSRYDNVPALIGVWGAVEQRTDLRPFQADSLAWVSIN